MVQKKTKTRFFLYNFAVIQNIAVCWNSLLFIYNIQAMSYAYDTKLVACTGTVWYLYWYTSLIHHFNAQFFTTITQTTLRLQIWISYSPKSPLARTATSWRQISRRCVGMAWAGFVLLWWTGNEALYHLHHCIPCKDNCTDCRAPDITQQQMIIGKRLIFSPIFPGKSKIWGVAV